MNFSKISTQTREVGSISARRSCTAIVEQRLYLPTHRQKTHWLYEPEVELWLKSTQTSASSAGNWQRILFQARIDLSCCKRSQAEPASGLRGQSSTEVKDDPVNGAMGGLWLCIDDVDQYIYGSSADGNTKENMVAVIESVACKWWHTQIKRAHRRRQVKLRRWR